MPRQFLRLRKARYDVTCSTSQEARWVIPFTGVLKVDGSTLMTFCPPHPSEHKANSATRTAAGWCGGRRMRPEAASGAASGSNLAMPEGGGGGAGSPPEVLQ